MITQNTFLPINLVDYSQYDTTDATTYTISYRFTPQANEAGVLLIYYNAVNTSSGAAAYKLIMVRYKMSAGVTTLPNTTNVYSNADSGMTTATAAAVVSGTAVTITVLGIAATTIRHSLRIERLGSLLQS